MPHRITLSLALSAALAIVALGSARADEAPPAGQKPKLKLNRDAGEQAAAVAEKKKADKTKADQKEAAAKAARAPEKKPEAADRFAVPEGGVKELLAFIKGIMNYSPSSQEDVRQWRSKGFAAMKHAAEKVKRIATDEDKKLPGFAEADGALLYFRAQEASADTPEENRKLADDLKQYFADNAKPSRYGVNAAQQLAMALEYSKDPTAAVPVYRELGAALASNSDRQTAETGLKMEGAARRLDLVGKPLEISGTEMDGSEFDWDSLRGKVVLVDFWATWCGPCLREIPNVKKNYELYHDKGFEVVAISLDDDRAALEKFLADNEKPWITLHDGGWKDNSVATYYGIMGIPTVILVDQQGKVVDTRARGPKLGKLLAELLGPADGEEKTSDDKPAAEKSD